MTHFDRHQKYSLVKCRKLSIAVFLKIIYKKDHFQENSSTLLLITRTNHIGTLLLGVK